MVRKRRKGQKIEMWGLVFEGTVLAGEKEVVGSILTLLLPV